MGAANSNQNNAQQVSIYFVQELCGRSRWSYEVGSPVPPLLTPHLPQNQWDSLLEEIYAATQPIQMLKFVGIAIAIQFIVFSVLSTWYPSAVIPCYAVFIGGIFYIIYMNSRFKSSLRDIESKYRPMFQSFATFEFIGSGGGRHSRQHMHFRINVVGAGTQSQPGVVYPAQQQTISVTIPQGVYGGQNIMVQGLDGAQFSVQVPAGMQPGQTFNVVPPPSKPAAVVYAQQSPMITATVVSVSDNKY
jgi:hypothetical protein